MITLGRVALSVACAVALSGCAANMQSNSDVVLQDYNEVYSKNPASILAESLNGYQQISLQELNPEQLKITFPGVTSFDFAARDINQEQKRALDTLIEALGAIEFQALEVVGHTDNLGNYDYNVQLSKDRARVVMDYLLALGVPSNRLGFDGKGPDAPIADNRTALGQAQNRRIEILVYL